MLLQVICGPKWVGIFANIFSVQSAYIINLFFIREVGLLIKGMQ